MQPKKEDLLNDKASIVVFREADSTKAFLSQCDIYACGEDNLTADLEFICKDGAVPAHQFILASHSQFICQILNRFTCLFTSFFCNKNNCKGFKTWSSACPTGAQARCSSWTDGEAARWCRRVGVG